MFPLTGFTVNKFFGHAFSSCDQKENMMGQTDHDTGDNNQKQQGTGHIGKKVLKEDKSASGRPDKGGTAGQSGGEQAKNRSSNPDSVQD